MKRRFEENVIDPITRNFVSSVGTANGSVVWLRLNSLDPHHPNGYDQWVVPANIVEMYINDGQCGGPYRSFQDHDLERIVSEHPRLQALDLRSTAVTDEGLSHLARLSELKWLWLDPAQCSDQAPGRLHTNSSLQSLWLDPDSVSAEALTELEKSLPKCVISDVRLPEARRERVW